MGVVKLKLRLLRHKRAVPFIFNRNLGRKNIFKKSEGLLSNPPTI